MTRISVTKVLGVRTVVFVVIVLFLFPYVLLLRSPLLRDGGGGSSAQRSHRARCKKVGISAELKHKISSFLGVTSRDAKVGLVNMGADETEGWRTIEVELQRVPKNLQWEQLFPEWIDEDEVEETPSCPEMPMPDYSKYEEVDAVVARLPCRYHDGGWARDVFRLQVHLAAANFAAQRARRDRDGRVKLIFQSQCQPMKEIFRIQDLVEQADGWWLYLSDARRLMLKVSLPVGSCRLALSCELEGSRFEAEYYKSQLQGGREQREAYATVLHSSQAYVCGAIVLAHSIRRSGSTRDLVLLHDRTISDAKLGALTAAGWKLVMIERIRNPHAEKNTYNEYNYSKLRLWQLTDYDKVVFLDADSLVLLNIDHLFLLPEMTAAGNDGFIFNSGVMVIEPSNATFTSLMSRRHEIVSYNGGDQGFLNEAFVWWHRLPRRMNFLRLFSANTSLETAYMNRLFKATPPEINVIHFLGQKPWLCYRDYDCNWNIRGGGLYASDEAHKVWWRLHDGIGPDLQRFCWLPNWRKNALEEERAAAEAAGNPDGHWKIKIEDERQILEQ